jgi:hypothetical protein
MPGYGDWSPVDFPLVQQIIVPSPQSLHTLESRGTVYLLAVFPLQRLWSVLYENGQRALLTTK